MKNLTQLKITATPAIGVATMTMAMLALAPLTAPAAIDIPLVEIPAEGEVANAPDTVEQWDKTSGYGAVGYTYGIGQTEVTVEQYRDFLNAVDSGGTNSLGLYNDSMRPGSWGCGIVLDGDAAAGSKYSVAEGYEGKPVNYVSWWDAARFCNWLTNNQPEDGSGTETGMYTLDGHEEDGDVSVTRNAAAWAAGGYALPSEDEWYKAAYYNQNAADGITDGTYTPYATGANVSQLQANYWDGGYAYTDANGNHLAPAGTYGAAEQNGTFDMMGNVFEWTEGVVYDNVRGLRGGSFDASYDYLASSARYRDYPADVYFSYGFRVSSLAVPEPSTYGLMGGAVLLGMMMLRRRKNRVTL